MIKIFLYLLLVFSTVHCSNTTEKLNNQRMTYAKFLRNSLLGKTKKQSATFLEKELGKKQDELVALEGMRHGQESSLANHEQHEREMGTTSEYENSLFLNKASRRLSLREISIRIDSVERSIFDIRSLLSEF